MNTTLCRLLPGLTSLALLLTPAGAAALAAPAPADPVVTPGLSKVDCFSQMGTPLVTVSDAESQTGTLVPLAAGVVQSGGASGTLTHDISGSAVFAGARSGTVELDYVRADTSPFGTGVVFGGQARFRYEFSSDTPTTVSVDYDVLGTEDNPGNSWYAMQGFRVTVNGVHQDVNFSLMFLFPPKPYAPQDFQGTFTFAVPAGNSYLEITDSASSSGNQYQSVRTMVGRFGWRIGPPVELVDVGHALAGTHGAPVLTGTGSLVGGSPLSLTLDNALEDVLATLVAGFAQVDAAFKGGVLVPAPDVVLGGLPTGPSGQFTLDTAWPVGLPTGFALYLQFWLPDPTGPQGFAASNGLAAVVP